MQWLCVLQSVTEFFNVKDNSQYCKVTELNSLNKYDEKRDNDAAKKWFFQWKFYWDMKLKFMKKTMNEAQKIIFTFLRLFNHTEQIWSFEYNLMQKSDAVNNML